MSDYILLGPTEVVGSRPFTNPDQTAKDMLALRRMAQRLSLVLGQPEGLRADPPPLTLRVNLREANGRDHRIVISQREALLTDTELTLVGFFGEKRPEADPTPLSVVDEELIREFAQYPGVLSYSSLELEQGNWGNLVVLSHPDAKEHWRTSARHAYAVRELAPKYYRTIRLHNGALPGGLLSGSDLNLLRTKYYDFQGEAPWLAVRESV